MAQVLATQPLPAGRRVAIVGNAGGPGVLAADACEAAGLDVPELAGDVQERLRDLLGEVNAVANPIDLAATTTPALFRQALDAALADPGVDAALAIFTAPIAPFADEVGDAIVAAAAAHPAKPVLACVLGRHVIIERGPHAVPSFDFPESAALALARVARYAEWRSRPEGAVRSFADVDAAAARSLVAAGLGSDDDAPRSLDPATAIALLECYRIPVAPSLPDGGEAFVIEVMLDPLFGHLVAVGPGGLPTVREFRSLPLTDLDAGDLVRSVAPDATGLEELLGRISALVEDLPEVAALHLGVAMGSPPNVTVGPDAIRLAPWLLRPERAVRRLR